MNPLKFSASFDKLTKGITRATTVLLILFILLPLFIKTYIGWITSGVLAIAYIVCFCMRPISYEIAETHIIIHQQFSKVIIDKQSIISVREVPPGDLSNSIRTFGVGGLFGFFGKFYNRKIGKMQWYATRRNNAVLIVTTNNSNIIITPDQPAAFVDAYDNKLL